MKRPGEVVKPLNAIKDHTSTDAVGVSLWTAQVAAESPNDLPLSLSRIDGPMPPLS